MNPITKNEQQLAEAQRYIHPRGDLLNGARSEYMDKCVRMYKASITGNWDDMLLMINENHDVVRCSITENRETALHVGSMGKSTEFVENLVNEMEPQDLILQNKEGNTALCLAVIAGNIEMVKIMVVKNPELLVIHGRENMMPLYLAALYRNHEMVTYLYRKSERMTIAGWTVEDRNMVFLKCIEVNFFDVALKILEDNVDVPEGTCVCEVLQVLARKSCAFDDIEQHVIWKIINSMGYEKKEREATQLLRLLWRKVVMQSKNEVDKILKGPMIDHNGRQTHPSQIIFIAAEAGNVNFLIELINIYPDLLWRRNDKGQTIFHVAVSHRRESVYSLLYEIGSMKDLMTPLIDEDGNSMFHLAGMNPQKDPYEDLFTTPFQMQRESQWFKEVKAMIPPSYREVKNKAGRTPSELFRENHGELVSKSKKWIKGTTNQCMVAAVLIATIGFSVVFTIPGGYDQNNGFPQFLHDGHLIAFVVLNAISFMLSSVSILMFLSIVISRYAQTDFLESLPQKLLLGLATLFLSIVTMMIAFGISFFILYYHKFMLLPRIIGILAAITVILYSKLQYPLLVAVFNSRYGSRYLFKPKKRMLYSQNPSY